MRGRAPGYSRYFTRYDKETLRSRFGTVEAHGERHRLVTSPNTWTTAPAGWAQGSPDPIDNKILVRPRSVTSRQTFAPLAWTPPSGDPYYAAYGPFAPYWSDHEDFSASSLSGFSSPAVVSNGGAEIRIYRYLEAWTGDQSSHRKRLSYIKSTDGGATWSTVQYPLVLGNYITTRADGIAAAYDAYTKTYLVAWLGCTEAGCTTVRGITEPAPGSALTSTVGWGTTIVATATPSIACHPTSTAGDRCLIAFKPGGADPRIAWQEGAISSSGANPWTWTSSANFQGSHKLHASPSVAWATFDSAFHVSLFVAEGPDSTIRVRRKQYGSNTWDNMSIVRSGNRRTISPAFLVAPTLIDRLDAYYLVYE
jgi:hypothetical protein